MDELMTVKKQDTMQLNLFQNSNTYKLDFLNSITICKPLYIQLRVKSSIYFPCIQKSQEPRERLNASAQSLDASLNIANALQKEGFVEFSANVKIVKILARSSIPKRRMLKKAVSVPSQSAKRIIANAIRRVSHAPRNVVA